MLGRGAIAGLDCGAEVRGAVVDLHRGIMVDLDNGAVEDLEARAELKTTRAGGKQMTTTEEPVEQATRAEHVTKVKPAKQKTTTGLEAMVEQRHGEATWL